MSKKLLALYGLKWNPFAPDVPIEALQVSRRIESFCWRAEQLVGEGGFALTGAPGTGKSVTLRILAERLGAQRDVIAVAACRGGNKPRSASSPGHKPAPPTSIASWAICSALSCGPITVGTSERR